MLISIVIPTYKRLDCLKRAIEHVRSQTFKNWELIVTDDESSDETETWDFLQGLASQDSRIRPVKNNGPNHGQVYNVNNGLRATNGDWVKILFDDDGMLPRCLEQFAKVAEKCPNAALIGCRAQTWRNGIYLRDEKNFQRHPIEIIKQKDCIRAMCMMDRWNGTTPTHVMARGDLVRSGYGMVEDDTYKMVVDTRWFAHILSQGDYVMMSDVLVQQRQGEVDSLTSECMAESRILDEENLRVYIEILDKANKDKTWPSKKNMISGINAIRGLYNLMHLNFHSAIPMLCKSLTSSGCISYSARWILQKGFPGHFTATMRERIA